MHERSNGSRMKSPAIESSTAGLISLSVQFSNRSTLHVDLEAGSVLTSQERVGFVVAHDLALHGIP